MKVLFSFLLFLLCMGNVNAEPCTRTETKRVIKQFKLPVKSRILVNRVDKTSILAILIDNESPEEGNQLLVDYYYKLIKYIYLKIIKKCPDKLDRIFVITKEYSYTISSKDIEVSAYLISMSEKWNASIKLRTSRIEIQK